MNSGSAPHTTRSSTTIATRAWPTVPYRPARRGPPVTGQLARVEQPGEPPEPPDHLRPCGPRHRGPHQLDGPVPGLDVDPGRRIAACAASYGAAGPVRPARPRHPVSSRCLPRSDSATGIG